jgi:ribosomal protein S18 acetylase RimI-like enzyme
VDTVAHLWNALVAYHSELDESLPPAAPQGERRYARRLIDRLDDPMSRVLVADVDGQVVGYVLGVIVDLAPEMFQQEASGFLADIYVDEAYRRAGAGRALVVELASWFRQQGIRYFEWHVAARNEDSIAFWRSLGGREVMLRMRADLD